MELSTKFPVELLECKDLIKWLHVTLGNYGIKVLNGLFDNKLN